MTALDVLMTGDLILDEPNPDWFFEPSLDTLRQADVRIGHVEVPFTDRAVPGFPANPSRSPSKLKALGNAGFDMVTLAANHLFDAGPAGVQDTVEALRAQGIETAGAGMNIEEARQPAIVERKGVRIGLLSYNCVGPKESWAGPNKAGGAYVHVVTAYELDYASPGGPPRIYTFADPDHLEAMQADIQQLAQQVHVVVVGLHKGLVHTPARVDWYEKQIARAAVDAGAHVVFSHHAHIPRGMEVYRGRPIFHGLGNFVTVTRVLNVKNNPSPANLEWARRRKELFGFEPDPDYECYAFHPESKNAMLGYCRVDEQGVVEAGFLPCWVNKDGRPEVLRRDERGEAVAAYVESITRKARLNAEFWWQGDRVLFSDRQVAGS